MAEIRTDRTTYASDFIKSDHDQVRYLDSAHSDNLMAAFLGLGAEHWALRCRLRVLETLLASSGVIDPARVEAFEPSAQDKLAWEAERDDFIERTFRVLVRESIAVLPTELPTGKVKPRPVISQPSAPGYGA